MLIEKEIRLNKWEDATKKEIIKFWEGREFQFHSIEVSELKGRRGSFLGNFISFDMKKLVTNISIHIRSDMTLVCNLNINTIMQIITESNKRYWYMELNAFERYLLKNEFKNEEWERIITDINRNNKMWLFKIFIIGFLFGILFEIYTKIYRN